MLKCVFEHVAVVRVVVAIDEEVVVCGEDIRRRQIAFGQEYLLGVLDFKNLLGVICDILGCLESQICVDVLISRYLQRVVYANGAMVCCYRYFYILLFEYHYQLVERTVFKPRLRQ